MTDADIRLAKATLPVIRNAARDYVVAVTVATEVPPDAPEAEFRAVIDVIRNRMADDRFPTDEVEVCLQPRQFSAVCREDYWRLAMAGRWLPSHVAKCYALWRREWTDTTDGATHYFSPIGMSPTGTEPDWAASPEMEEVEVVGVRADYFRFFRWRT